MYEESTLYPQHQKHTLRQVQAGLLFVDAANTTMRDTFFTEWAACAHNYDCLIPDNIRIDKHSKHYLSADYTIEEYGGARVFRLVVERAVIHALAFIYLFICDYYTLLFINEDDDY
jgi:hypothetical protein